MNATRPENGPTDPNVVPTEELLHLRVSRANARSGLLREPRLTLYYDPDLADYALRIVENA